MKLVTFLPFLLYIQNAEGFLKNYQMQYLKAVPVSWPYNLYYYPTYRQQPKFHVSSFLVAPGIICKNSSKDQNSLSQQLKGCQMVLLSKSYENFYFKKLMLILICLSKKFLFLISGEAIFASIS